MMRLPPVCSRLAAGLVASLLLASCGGGGSPSGGSGPSDAGGSDVDAGPADVAPDLSDGGGDVRPDGGGRGLCSRCADDSECGESGDRCIQLLDSEFRCARQCDLKADSPCPDGYECRRLQREAESGQCVPEKLTCRDRCADVDCSDGKRCDPITGDCREPLALCDTRCTVDSICGDGPEDRCLTLNQGERVCATGCNPEDDDRECPVDYFCAPTSEEDPTAGACVPIRRTCVDRCSDVDCSGQKQCDPSTGNCVEPKYGACEKGCTSNAECAGTESWCLDLGLQPGRYCWQGCSGEGTCPDGYMCGNLRGTTLSLCIPTSTNQTCQKCPDDACFPEGVCNPVSGKCLERDTDCTKTGCPSGKVCNPRSTDCVEVGRRCKGKTWATDCDGIATGCTTHTAGTAGVCARICSSDSECSGDRKCRATNLKADDFCIGPAELGPDACGTLDLTATDGGAPCSNDGDCSGDAPTCVDGANTRGFCSTSCSSDSDCGPLQRCGTGPGGRDVCLPMQCECAAHSGLESGANAALDTALSEIGLGQCELISSQRRTEKNGEVQSLPLSDESLLDRLRMPLSANGRLEARADAASRAISGPGEAVERIVTAGGASVSAKGTDYTFGGGSSPLVQAAEDLISAAGGTPNSSKLKQIFKAVPSNARPEAADIVAAAADAVAARNSALSSAGWGNSRRKSAYRGAPYLFLPGTSAQKMRAPDLSKSSVAKAYETFPADKLAKAAADLGASIDLAGGASGVGSGDFVAIADTPAGKVIVGGPADDVYNPKISSKYSGDIAVLVDLGGKDFYRVPAGANQSADNGVSVLVDLGGADTYTYVKKPDPNDEPGLRPSDADGRKSPNQPLGQGNGPVSLSTTARQGAGRIGIGMLVDYGKSGDKYRSLRMSQGAAVFGVGLLYDDGGDDLYRAEALAQGAALGGYAGLWDAGGSEGYRMWHAGQGFGTAGGAGLLGDPAGKDVYHAVPGYPPNGKRVLYFSPAHRGKSNRNLAQGAGAGVEPGSGPGLAGGVGVLADGGGGDQYRAGTYAQGFGSFEGAGLLLDRGGADSYRARVLVQGVGRFLAGGVFADREGDDTYNASTGPLRTGQGYGEAFGWGVFHESRGDDTIHYANPGGGVGQRGGYGIAVDARGSDTHDLGNSQTRIGPGFARDANRGGSPFKGELSVGIFLEAGGSDSYSVGTVTGTNIGDGTTWRQPDPPTSVNKGVGVDR
ncbi:MAG: hypothetical protein ABEL76_01285 [Bradymonadaceae bacterium]